MLCSNWSILRARSTSESSVLTSFFDIGYQTNDYQTQGLYHRKLLEQMSSPFFREILPQKNQGMPVQNIP
jgi:hypothetical protein